MKDALLSYVKKVKALHEKVKGNEEATKYSLIAPLFVTLGYDLADPEECIPEFKADFGKARGKEPVDWAFYQNGRPIFLVEAKEAGKNLGGYDEQLGDYFGKADVVLGILTNGIMWRFFTDIVKIHRMDTEPFVKWDVLNDAQPPYDFLTLLHKSQFRAEGVRKFADEQHRHNRLVKAMDKLLEPSAEFTRLAIANIELKNKTADVVENWKPRVARAIEEWASQRRLVTVLTQRPLPDDSNSAPGPTREQDKREQTRRARQGISLADLIGAGILTPPLKVFRKYKGKRLEATLISSGAVQFQGQHFDTCSAAAEAARATVAGQRLNTNGWTFWQYLRADGSRSTLSDARHQVVPTPRDRKDESVGAGNEGRAIVDAVSRMGKRTEKAERHVLRKRFWEGLLSRPKAKSTRHAEITPGESGWIGAGSGVRGLPLNYVIGQDEGRVELWIDRGVGKAAENKEIFDSLHKHKLAIEKSFGGALSWQRLDDKQGCRIAYLTAGGYSSDQSKWPGIHDVMIDAMIRLESALASYLAKLKSELASES